MMGTMMMMMTVTIVIIVIINNQKQQKKLLPPMDRPMDKPMYVWTWTTMRVRNILSCNCSYGLRHSGATYIQFRWIDYAQRINQFLQNIFNCDNVTYLICGFDFSRKSAFLWEHMKGSCWKSWQVCRLFVRVNRSYRVTKISLPINPTMSLIFFQIKKHARQIQYSCKRLSI